MRMDRGERVAGRAILAWVVFLLALAAVPAAAASEAEAGPTRFTYSGKCTELQYAVGAEQDELRRLVAPGFTPIGSPLKPSVTVGVVSCGEASVDGRPVAPWAGSLVGTFLVPREAGLERYWLWNAGDSPDVDEVLRALGLRTALVPGVRLELGASKQGMQSARGVVPWEGAEYRVDGTVAGGVGAPLAGTSAFWQRGSRGLVKVTFRISEGTSRPTTGTVSARPGTELARLMGNPSSKAAGLLIDFRFEATGELVGD